MASSTCIEPPKLEASPRKKRFDPCNWTTANSSRLPAYLPREVDKVQKAKCNYFAFAPYVSAPTMAPIRHVDSVPDTIDLNPSDTTSSRRSGAMVARPPIMMPRLPKLAKPHSP